MPEFQQTSLTAPSGAQINLRYMLPKARPRAVVQINHGMAEHAARYERFAGALAAADIASYVADQRGHGYTTAPDAPPGVLAARDGFQRLSDDALAVNDYISAQHPDTPVVLFGHSMGSILSLYFALQHPDRMQMLVLWNSGVDTGMLTAMSRLILTVERAFRGRARPSRIANTLTFDTWNKAFKPNRTGFDWLSRDSVEVDLYIADPLCGFVASTGLWLDLLDGVAFGADDRNLAALPKALPVHLLGGGVDPCSDKGRAMQRLAGRMQQAGMMDVRCDILPDTRHESLNEINRNETTGALIGWLHERLVRL